MESQEILDIIERATSDIGVVPPVGVMEPSRAYHMQWKSDPGTMQSGEAVEGQRAYDQEQFLKELLMVPRLKREEWNKEGAPLWEYTGEGEGVGALTADILRFPLDTILAPHNVMERLQAWEEKRLPNDEKIATVLEAAGVGLDVVGLGHVGKKILGSVGEAGEVALKGLKKEKALSNLVERIPPEAEAIFKHDAYLHAPSEEALQKLRDWDLPYMYSYKPDKHNMSYIEMGDNPIENIPELKMILSSEGHSAYPMLREMLRDLEVGGHSQLSASIINEKFKNILGKTGLMSKSPRSKRDIIDLEYPKLHKLLGRGERMSETSATKGTLKRKGDVEITFSDEDLANIMDELTTLE